MLEDTLTLSNKRLLTSAELISLYGLKATHQNASRVARRLVETYNIPFTRHSRNYWVNGYADNPDMLHADLGLVEA